MTMPKITVFTPTYNRAYILPKCFESLNRQSCKDFEWLIIDDGSTDQTKELVTDGRNVKMGIPFAISIKKMAAYTQDTMPPLPIWKRNCQSVSTLMILCQKMQ